jgi:hypothetical protein
VIVEEAKESSRLTESARQGSVESLKGFGTQNIPKIQKCSSSDNEQLGASDDENVTERFYQ